uniref:Uncharacterized protein n=1 Tax=Quercus lobata TaxID=97700 RepID=A0A7N2M8T4_QUELO
MEEPWNELPQMANDSMEDNFVSAADTLTASGPATRSISISSCCQSPLLQDPPLSESPKIGNIQRKSMNISSSSHLVSQNSVSESSKFNLDVLRHSLKQKIDKANASVQTLPEERPSSNGPSASFLCTSCQRRISEKDSNEVKDSLKTWIVAVDEAENPTQLTDEVPKDAGNAMIKGLKQEELESVCVEQAAKIEQLNRQVEQYKLMEEEHSQEINKLHLEASKNEIVPFKDSKNDDYHSLRGEDKLLRYNSVENYQPEIIKEKCEIKEVVEAGTGNQYFDLNEKEALLKEIESLKSKLQSYSDPSSNKEAGDGVDIIEEVHFGEKYNDLVGKHRAIMDGIAEVKRAAAMAGKKGHGSRFAKSLAAELYTLRVERERERELLKKENKSLRIQLRDTAEAVHAAGELLVRLREAEHVASVAEDNFTKVQQDNETLKKQVEKLKRKHKMEMVTVKQYLAESRLPESALQPLYRQDSDVAHNTTIPYADDDQAWRAEFGAIYQEH